VAHSYIQLPPFYSPQTHHRPWPYRLQETFGTFYVFFAVFILFSFAAGKTNKKAQSIQNIQNNNTQTKQKNKNNSNKPSKTLVDIQHRYLHAIEAFKIR
jgi:hypothetical protein